MPITRTYAKKANKITSDFENNSFKNSSEKENAFVRKKSKLKDGKKFPKVISDDSFTFTHIEKKVDDSFDLLVASPMKQPVNFKPLSFWSKKVQDLECKKNSRKVKCELYELSGSDDSSSAHESKKSKKKARGKMGQSRKREKKVNKHECVYDVKNLVKNTYRRNESHPNKEGSIVRERIILSRLNNNYSESEDKFSFKKIDSFGLTSTPERNKKLNVVGGSNFQFLSPISRSDCFCQDNNRADFNHLNHSEDNAPKYSESCQNSFQDNVVDNLKSNKNLRERNLNYTEQNDSITIGTLEKLNENILTQSATDLSESFSQLRVSHLSEGIFKTESENNVYDVNCSFLSKNSFTNVTVKRMRNCFNYSIKMNACHSPETDFKIEIKKDLTFLSEKKILSNSFPNAIKKRRKVDCFNSLDFIFWDAKSCGTENAEDKIIESLSLNVSNLNVHYETEMLSKTDFVQASKETAIENRMMKLSSIEVQKTEHAYVKSVFLLYSLKLLSVFPDLCRSAVDLRELSPPHFSNYCSQQVGSISALLLQNDSSLSSERNREPNSSSVTAADISSTGIHKTSQVPARTETPNFSQSGFPYVTIRRRNERDILCNSSLRRRDDGLQLRDRSEEESVSFCESHEAENLRGQSRNVSPGKKRSEFSCPGNGNPLRKNSTNGLNQYRSRVNDVTLIELKMMPSFNAGDDSSVYDSSCEMSGGCGSGNVSRGAHGAGCDEAMADNRKSSNGSGVLRSITNDTSRRSLPRTFADVSDLFYSAAAGFTRCDVAGENETTGNFRSKGCSGTVRVSCGREEGSSITEDLTFCEEFEFPLPIFESTAFIPVNSRGIKQGNSSGVRNMETTTEKSRRGEIKLKGLEDQTRASEINFNKINVEDSRDEQSNLSNCLSKIKQFNSFVLKPGKQWARSALILKKIRNGTITLNDSSLLKTKGKNYHTFMEEVVNMQGSTENQTLYSPVDNSSVTLVTSHLSNLTVRNKTSRSRTVKVLEEKSSKEAENSFRNVFKNNGGHHDLSRFKECTQGKVSLRGEKIISAKDLVLSQCNQEKPFQFEEYFNDRTLKNCKKIGEGVFGEVFMCNSNRVFKVMPIEGSIEVNGEPQKKFKEILSEIIIARELSNLQNHKKFKTKGFSELKKCWCVVGKYPRYLLNLWNEFDVSRGSENDSPVIFESHQLYIILEFANGGKDLESFIFSSAEQSLSIFFQATYSLAVAEKALEFEHRDLHWGNILISQTKDKYFKIRLDEKEYKIPTKGVRVTIIDFTLSRMTYDGCCIYNDLAVDPTLFAAQGDYQFEIYRLMKNEVKNDWSLFEPKTNLYWLHYVLDKMLSLVRYKRTNTKIHKENLSILNCLKSSILQYSSSEEFLLKENLFQGDTID